MNLTIIDNRYFVYYLTMSTEKKNRIKRDQALNDATGGQFGEEPSDLPQSFLESQKNESDHRKVARKFSKTMS